MNTNKQHWLYTAGLGILRSLLADNGVSQVTYLGRRPLPPWVILPGGTSTDGASPTHPKLSTVEHKDFLSYPPAIQETIAQHDACIWALGISAVGMSEAKYTEITVGYFSAFLDVLKEKAVGTEGSPFRVIFVSGMGADSKEKSRVLFERVKVRKLHQQLTPLTHMSAPGPCRKHPDEGCRGVRRSSRRINSATRLLLPVQSIPTGCTKPARSRPAGC